MFDQALKLDPNNAKANFYSSFTKPLLTMKGFISRLEPIVDDDKKFELQALRERLEAFNLPEITRFANQIPLGKAPFTSYHDLQRFFRTEVLPTILESSKKLESLNGKKIELNINLSRLGLQSNCYHHEIDGWNCTAIATTFIVDEVDLKTLRGSIMAFGDVIRLNTAYSLSGLEQAIHRIHAIKQLRKRRDQNLTTRDIVRVIQEHRDLFVLEPDHQLPELARSAEEVLRHAMDLHAMDAEICQNAERLDSQSLIKSLCIDFQIANKIEASLDFLAGPKNLFLGTNGNGERVEILVDLPRLLYQPPRDLKALLPTHFDAMGNANRYPDPTLGGVFPNGDFIEKLNSLGQLKMPNLKKFWK